MTLRGDEHDADHNEIALNAKARVAPYAEAATGRIAADFADYVDDLMAHPNLDQEIETFWSSVNAKLDGLRSGVTRYAEPPWNVGYIGYGTALGHFDVLMDWVSEDDDGTCDDCLGWDKGSPYAVGDMPSWPGNGDSQCLDRCRCTIQAESDSWDAAFGDQEE